MSLKTSGRKKTASYGYKLLARFYDQLFYSHHNWYSEARQVLLGNILSNVRFACDLACGTGVTALDLAGRGIEVFAVDLSPGMCRITREKAARAGVAIQVLRRDIRSFQLPQPVDLITCEFDGINHLPDEADLARVLNAVARALRPDGYFYFDVNERKAFETLWPGTWTFEKDQIVTTISGGYDRRRGRGWTDIEWRLRRANRAQIFHEHIEQVCWDPDEIRELLSASGFVRIRSRDGTQFDQRDPRVQPGCRTFYLAQKSGHH